MEAEAIGDFNNDIPDIHPTKEICQRAEQRIRARSSDLGNISHPGAVSLAIGRDLSALNDAGRARHLIHDWTELRGTTLATATNRHAVSKIRTGGHQTFMPPSTTISTPVT